MIVTHNATGRGVVDADELRDLRGHVALL